MVVGVWEGCCYILRRDLLAERACDRESVLWLELAAVGTRTHMRAASPEDQEVCCWSAADNGHTLLIVRTQWTYLLAPPRLGPMPAKFMAQAFRLYHDMGMLKSLSGTWMMPALEGSCCMYDASGP